MFLVTRKRGDATYRNSYLRCRADRTFEKNVIDRNARREKTKNDDLVVSADILTTALPFILLQ